jgi:hypothetical protein
MQPPLEILLTKHSPYGRRLPKLPVLTWSALKLDKAYKFWTFNHTCQVCKTTALTRDERKKHFRKSRDCEILLTKYFKARQKIAGCLSCYSVGIKKGPFCSERCQTDWKNGWHTAEALRARLLP